MNVYDFDETIYVNDSTVDLMKHIFTHYPKCYLCIPGIITGFIGWKVFGKSKESFKEKVFKVFTYIDNPEGLIDQFTDDHLHLIKGWYKDQQKPDDVIISASPYFLIESFCKKLGIQYVMASPVDLKTGKYQGINCHGKEKVRRYREVFGEAVIDEFYSDSYSDTPLAEIAQKAYMVKGDRRDPWGA
ncbi:MAG: haloacid dehalogenase-like hydrolase [Erysipelotrichaceae bacterium]|nr:haloacid dehalogenase-like hydrolase [Erysipelotrichaceae bacterium]